MNYRLKLYTLFILVIFTLKIYSAELYNITFNSPAHTVGSLPATGNGPAPRSTVSDVVFGDPRIVANYIDLPGQSLAFDTYQQDNYDQIRLRLDNFPDSAEAYCLEFDISIKEMESGNIFAVILDLPSVRNIYFWDTGDVLAGSNVIGSFTFGKKMHVKVSFNLSSDTWSIYLDGSLVLSDAGFGSATIARGIRFNSGRRITSATPGVRAAIDNILVSSGECPQQSSTPNTPSQCDDLKNALLVGTYDLRSGQNTLLSIINPTSSYKQVYILFYDDNEEFITCHQEKLSPNDLAEIDVRKAIKKNLFGVVKVIPFEINSDSLAFGIKGYQRQLRHYKYWLFFSRSYESQTILQPIPTTMYNEKDKKAMRLCR